MSAALLSLGKGSRFAELPFDCGNATTPGVEEAPEWADWSERDTTHDQVRIEAWLLQQDIKGLDLLHVGVGNSSLGERFAPLAGRVDGITVTPRELVRAQALGIPNYQVRLLNKYSPALVDHLGRQYGLIIDNNPTAFACCWTHFARMLSHYACLLRPGGQLVSDRWGVHHSVTGNHARWRFDLEDWMQAGCAAGLVPRMLTDVVVALSRKD